MEISEHCNLLENSFLKSIRNIKPPLIFPGYFSFRPQQRFPMTYHAVLYILQYLYHTLLAFYIPKFTWTYASTLNKRHLGNSSFLLQSSCAKITQILEGHYLSTLFERAPQIYIGCHYIVICIYL